MNQSSGKAPNPQMAKRICRIESIAEKINIVEASGQLGLTLDALGGLWLAMAPEFQKLEVITCTIQLTELP